MDLFSTMIPRIKFPKDKELTMNENFAGIGAFKKGFERAGFKVKVVAISEIDKYCIASYKEMHGEVSNLGAIGSFERLPAGVDVCTWSFPCQDISNAGRGKGMEEGTRSNYGFVFLETLKNTPIQERPKVLIMENVALLFSKKFHNYWTRILSILSECGYQNYPGKMNAKDFGVAQNRDRVFMVSVLGNYSYSFPNYIKLEKRLKDYLEDVVDEKYYLSDKMLNYVIGDSNGWERQYRPLTLDSEHSWTITAREGNVAESSYIAIPINTDETICLNSKVNGKQPSVQDRIYDVDGVSTAITTAYMPSITIPEATTKGYALAKDGDGVYLNRPHQKRGVVQDQMIQTLKTSGNDVGVVEIKDGSKIKLKIYNHIYDVEKNDDGNGGVNYIYHETGDYIVQDDKKRTYILTKDGYLFRVRKIMPIEVWRLMGISDDDFNKAQASGVSNSQLYKQAGNAIVVDVFEAILRRMIT